MARKTHTLIPLAGAVSAALFSMSAAAFEFHGYFRSGIGNTITKEGGDQVCFQVPGSPFKWRLGNECETYFELAFAENLYEKDGKTFRIEFRNAHESQQRNDFEGTLGEGPFAEFNIASREAFGKLDNYFGLGESIWAGKRFYQRHDIHIIDYYYWDTSGPGGGIENLDVGLGYLSLAWLRNTEAGRIRLKRDVRFTQDEGQNMENDIVDTDVANNVIDIRWAGINTNRNGQLEVGVSYGFATYKDSEDEISRGDDPENPRLEDPEDGYSVTLEHTQGNVFGGFNKAIFQIFADGMAANNFGSNGRNAGGRLIPDDGATLYRLIDWGAIDPSPSWSLGWSVQYQIYDADSDGGAQFASLGGRFRWNWNEIMGTTVDAGFDWLDPETNFDSDSQRDSDRRWMYKITAAQTWKAGRAFFARPELRAFVTFAKWRGRNSIAEGGKNTNGASVDNYFDDEKYGFTIGLQAEAWW